MSSKSNIGSAYVCKQKWKCVEWRISSEFVFIIKYAIECLSIWETECVVESQSGTTTKQNWMCHWFLNPKYESESVSNFYITKYQISLLALLC